ncbi:MAG: 30S ribosomal protein S18 [Tenericutes bacterium]|nr:MAG: 30S ribosomal protein S18 [Mycoplasmatota bacterium]
MPRTAKGKRTPKKIQRKPRFKVCLFEKQGIEYIDYKDVETLKKYISRTNGKILSSRLTGTSAKYQRKLAKAIKQSREVGLLPFIIQ